MSVTRSQVDQGSKGTSRKEIHAQEREPAPGEVVPLPPAMGKRPEEFVSYLRVSTTRQGADGLGIEAQRKAIAEFLNGGRVSVREFLEVESGRRDDNRPRLQEALAECRRRKATLVVARLDRLARDAHFLLGLQKAGVKFIAADFPEANELTIGILALVAQYESRLISLRTKAAMAAAKARGKKFGGQPENFRGRWVEGLAKSAEARLARKRQRARDLEGLVVPLRKSGATLQQIANALNASGHRTPRGAFWSPAAVREVLLTLEDQDREEEERGRKEGTSRQRAGQ